MSTSDALQRTHIDIPPNVVNLTFDDIFGPLTQRSTSLVQGQPGSTTDPEVAQHLQTLSGLLSQLSDVIGKINQIDPSILSPKPAPDATA